MKVCNSHITIANTTCLTTDTNLSTHPEERFRQKCKELKKRVLEVEQTNEVATIALSRTQAAIRRARLEYAILIERLEDRAQHLPDGINNFEEMAGPPTPSILDENLVKSTKNGSSKKSGKKAAANKGAGHPLLSPTAATTAAVLDARSLMNLGSASAENSATASTNATLAKTPKHRDPDLPKRPTNAYLLFCEQEKEKIRLQQQQDPENSARDLSKAMTEAWRNLSEADKKPFYKVYEEDKLRYNREMDEYILKKEAELRRERQQAEDDENGEGDTIGEGNEEEEGESHSRDEDEREQKRQKVDNGSTTEHQPQSIQIKIEQPGAE